MTVQMAISEAQRLWKIWVSDKPFSSEQSFNLDKIRDVIRQEMKFNHQMPSRCSEGNKRETRGHAILVGKIRKVLE
jgi:hypothetical protein